MKLLTPSIISFLCLLSYSVLAAVTVVAPGYTNSLSVHKDELTSDGIKAKQIVYTSVVEYDFDVSKFSDEEFAGLAQQAWEELVVLHANWINSCDPQNGQGYIKNAHPGMMSIIGVGKTLYIASSIKQNTPNVLLQNNDAILTRAMTMCRNSWLKDFDGREAGTIPDNDLIHRTRGSCGEITATALVLKHTGKLPWELGSSARVVAFGAGQVKKGKPGPGKLTDPCQVTPDDKKTPHNPIGCAQWVNWGKMGTINSLKTPKKVTDRNPSKVIDINLNDVWKIVNPFNAADTGPH